MWLKLIGSLMVVTATACIGFNLASQYIERPKQIRQLISCLSALKSHINYAAIPLPQVLKICTNGINGPVADLFHTVSGLLTANGWMTPQAAMEQALKEVNNLVLKKSEQEVLAIFSANLGGMNREEQQKSLNLAHEQLSRIQYEAEKLSEQNVKMYRYLGVCGGLIIVIVLV